MDYGSFPEYPPYWLKKTMPSKAGFTPALRRQLSHALLPTLEDLTERCVAPFEVTDTLRKVVEERGVRVVPEKHEFGPQDAGKRLFVQQRHRNAFCLIHPGNKSVPLERGVNIIVTHIDTPVLRVRVQPTWFEAEQERKYSNPGPYLEVKPFGGLHAPDWLSLMGRVTGRFIDEDFAERRVRLPAKILHTSFHLETDDETPEGFNRVRIFTGATDVKTMYKQFGIPSEEAFGAAELYFYPNTQFKEFGDFISAYGLDDRSCVTAAVHAFLDAKPRRPTFVFGLDAEEIGSIGPSGGPNGFFKECILSYLSHRLDSDRLLTMEDLYRKGVIGKIPAICGDVGPGISFNEDQAAELTYVETTRFGFGPFLNPSWCTFDGNAIPPHSMRYMINVMRSTFPRRNGTKKKWQLVGSEFKTEESQQFDIAHFAEHFTNDHLPMVALGVPVGDLHRPSGEMMYTYDFFLTKQAYQGYMEFSPPRNFGG